jgi:hypothetical protein
VLPKNEFFNNATLATIAKPAAIMVSGSVKNDDDEEEEEDDEDSSEEEEE